MRGLWHSVDDTEYKAVAYDMYEYLYGKGLDAYIPRIAIFSLSLTLITFMSFGFQFVLMARDKQLANVKSWLKFGKFTLNSYSKLIPKFFSYYRINFHPNETDEAELVKITKAKIGLDEQIKLLN